MSWRWLRRLKLLRCSVSPGRFARYGQVLSAVFSDDRKYRYRLDRDFGTGQGTYVWIGKNPSKADETREDNSVTRVMRRAEAARFRKFVVVNLYGYVSTDPRGLLDSWADAEGPQAPTTLGVSPTPSRRQTTCSSGGDRAMSARNTPHG